MLSTLRRAGPAAPATVDSVGANNAAEEPTANGIRHMDPQGPVAVSLASKVH